MARPKIFDFDPASEETVVTQGAECAELQWFGINPENGLVHIVCNVGTLNATGDGVEDITYRAIQITLEGQDALDHVQGLDIPRLGIQGVRHTSFFVAWHFPVVKSAFAKRRASQGKPTAPRRTMTNIGRR